jgi:hypothetical protein
MALHLVSLEEVRTACRQRVEACELWLRRLIHEQLGREFGSDYIQVGELNGQPIFRSEIRKHVIERIATAPGRYPRPIDALQLDHLASTICKADVYRKYFVDAMKYGFPLGNEHVRVVFERLVPIRNALSHANPISLHDAERALCYCSDLIGSLTQYYQALGMAEEFNAPSFTRFADSVGHVEYPTATDVQLNFTERTSLQAGQTVRFEVEVDSHFSPDAYHVTWQVANIPDAETGKGTAFPLTLTLKHVSTDFVIFVSVSSNIGWHRHGHHDARLVLVYRVLPPM